MTPVLRADPAQRATVAVLALRVWSALKASQAPRVGLDRRARKDPLASVLRARSERPDSLGRPDSRVGPVTWALPVKAVPLVLLVIPATEAQPDLLGGEANLVNAAEMVRVCLSNTLCMQIQCKQVFSYP